MIQTIDRFFEAAETNDEIKELIEKKIAEYWLSITSEIDTLKDQIESFDIYDSQDVAVLYALIRDLDYAYQLIRLISI
jgi:hypothetical protein